MDQPLFLDTSIIVAAILIPGGPARRLVFSSGWNLHTIEYVLKETRHVMCKRHNVPEPQVADVFQHIRSRVVVHRTPPAARFRKLHIRDKSDKPIVYAARSLGCILVIDDERTYRDAPKYVEAVRLDEL